MRLACLSTDPGVSYGGAKGAAVHFAEVTAALAAQGADVLVLVSSVVPGAIPPPGVQLEVLPGPGKQAPTRARLEADPLRAAWLEARLAAWQPAALYERFALHTQAGSLAARRLGVPHLVELNAALRDESARYRRLECPQQAAELERKVLGGADLVFAVSRPLAAYARRQGAYRAEVLPNAVALERFPRPGPRTARSRPVAVFAGSLRPWHGIATLAEAWQLLGAEAPDLLVIGDGRGREKLEAVGATTTGWVPHARVPALLQSADIGLAPYAPDAPAYFSPLKLFEYLAAGLAVVATALPGITDLVDECSALLVPAGSSEKLAEGVAALVADPRRRAALGASGRALVASGHTWAHRAEHILSAAVDLAPTPR